MSRIYSCPKCRTQNFATRGRLRKAGAVPLKCWKCGELLLTLPAEKRKQAPKKAI